MTWEQISNGLSGIDVYKRQAEGKSCVEMQLLMLSGESGWDQEADNSAKGEKHGEKYRYGWRRL